MKNRSLRVLALALLLALTVGVVPAMAAQASIVTQTLYENCGGYDIRLRNWTDNEKIIYVRSSRPDIIEVPDPEDLFIISKKAGRAKITIKYELRGSTQTISATYTVKKYPHPVKSVTVNGESADLSRGEHDRVCYDLCIGRDYYVKINLKPNSGWRIVSISGKYWKAGDGEFGRTWRLNVRNNRRFRVKEDCYTRVTYKLMNRSRKTFNYYVEIGEGE